MAPNEQVVVARWIEIGMRIGFALGNQQLIGALFKVKDSYNVDRLAQTAAEAAFRDQAYLRKTAARIKATRRRLTQTLERWGWEVLPSAANFVFARPAGIAATEVFARLRKKKVLVRHFPGAKTGRFIRISVGTDKEIDFLLNALQAILRN